MEYAGFVKVGSPIIFDKALKGRSGAEDGEEGVMIYEEWFRLWCGRGNDGRPVDGRSVHSRPVAKKHTAKVLRCVC